MTNADYDKVCVFTRSELGLSEEMKMTEEKKENQMRDRFESLKVHAKDGGDWDHAGNWQKFDRLIDLMIEMQKKIKDLEASAIKNVDNA